MSLIAFFKVMNNEIANMVEEHDRKLKDIADQEADGEVLSDADFEVCIRTKFYRLLTDSYLQAILFERKANEKACTDNTHSIVTVF